MIFTATRLQVATYLLGICPFSIAFLVFLNSSVSFVITDLIGQEDGVGDAVGNLGFADELVALVACPLWGLLSDRIGVRSVCVIGYAIISLALILFVQAKNVYPQLLLGRLFFSVGGAAASTMVTAVLPTMSYNATARHINATSESNFRGGHAQAASIASEQTITPALFRSNSQRNARMSAAQSDNKAATSRVAGFVGMFTGFGALLALALFLPLPARFQKIGVEPGHALQHSYYIVALVAAILAVCCFIGLRNLSNDNNLQQPVDSSEHSPQLFIRVKASITDGFSRLSRALAVGFEHSDIATGYMGGFVARASSVGISLFIPLLVNAAFLSSGLCAPKDSPGDPTGLPDIKRRCPRAYVLAAELTGVSQLIALLCAPAFGYWSARSANKNHPLMLAAACGVIGYPLLATRFDAHDGDTAARIISFFAVCLIGISQIGAIVCSLGSLSAGILDRSVVNEAQHAPQAPQTIVTDFAQRDTEDQPLLGNVAAVPNSQMSLGDLKGSMAGIYSFYGGAGILILTKAGGALFDSLSHGAPFYMLAAFNGILFFACFAFSIPQKVKR